VDLPVADLEDDDLFELDAPSRRRLRTPPAFLRPRYGESSDDAIALCDELVELLYLSAKYAKKGSWGGPAWSRSCVMNC